MKLYVLNTADELGKKAAELTAAKLNEAIAQRGAARIMVSTGASQFTTIKWLIQQQVEWQKVEMFHLDEYIGISNDHPASFIRYLKERLVSQVSFGAVHFVDTSIGADAIMEKLSREVNRAPIDIGLIGIGENAHIAFNDPPADFDDDSCYKIVTLDEACRRQQLGEGWFPTFDDVPKQAVSLTPRQIMRCRCLLSAVPYAVKAKAIKDTLENDVTNMIPATLLRGHPDFTLLLDHDSASLIDPSQYTKL